MLYVCNAACSPAQAAAAPSMLPEHLQHCMPGATQYSSPYGGAVAQDMWQQPVQQQIGSETLVGIIDLNGFSYCHYNL